MKKQTQNTTLSQEEKQELADLSDDKSTKSAPKFPLPSMRINGKTGGFFCTVLDKDGSLKINESDGKSLLQKVENPSGVILRVRKAYQHIGGDYQLFSTEGANTPKAKFTIFEKREGAKGDVIQAIFSGTPTEIKAKFPEIKMVQIVYFLLKDSGELVRLKIKGMSLGNVFDYFKEFENNEHSFEYYTILGEKKGKNKFGSFITATFTRGEKVEDFTLVKENMKLIADKISEIETYQAEREQEAVDMYSSSKEDAPRQHTTSKEMQEALDAAKNFRQEEKEYNENNVSGTKSDDEEIDVSKIEF
jgi:hypothetical protein